MRCRSTVAARLLLTQPGWPTDCTCRGRRNRVLSALRTTRGGGSSVRRDATAAKTNSRFSRTSDRIRVEAARYWACSPRCSRSSPSRFGSTLDWNSYLVRNDRFNMPSVLASELVKRRRGASGCVQEGRVDAADVIVGFRIHRCCSTGVVWVCGAIGPPWCGITVD